MKKIIIIGAGIVGATCAYQLSKKAVSVTLIDANINGRATSAAAGIICPWVTKRRNKAWYKLAKNGAAYYRNLTHELANDGFLQTGYKKVGAIRLHDDVTKLETLKGIAMTRRKDAPEIGDVQMLQPEEVKEKLPFIKDTFAGLWIEGAARVDGRLLRDTMIQAASINNVNIIEGKAILTKDKNGKVNVMVHDQLLDADQIIVTNGVWMKELFSPLQINVNVQAQKGEIIHLHVAGVNTASLPVIMPPNNQYMLSFDHGKIVIGTSHVNVQQLDTNITAREVHHILDQAFNIAPDLANSFISEIRVGFRPFTFNHLPVFGPVPNQEHILIANGLGSSGLTTGPYIGKQLAKLATSEETDLPIADYQVAQIIS